MMITVAGFALFTVSPQASVAYIAVFCLCCRWAHTGASGAQNDYHTHSACPADTPVPPLQPPPGVSGWSVAGLGKSCSAHCTDMGMLCSYAALQFYNGAVDSSEEVLHLIAIDASAAETSATVCVSHTGTLAPFFESGACWYKSPNASQADFRCQDAPSNLQSRLCYCMSLPSPSPPPSPPPPSPPPPSPPVPTVPPPPSPPPPFHHPRHPLARSARSAACATAITAALYTRRRRSLRPR